MRGACPGTGKRCICQKIVGKGHKGIVFCPTNKLLQAVEGEAMTITEFFGISYGDAEVESLDFTDYDTIVFDEVCFSGAF